MPDMAQANPMAVAATNLPVPIKVAGQSYNKKPAASDNAGDGFFPTPETNRTSFRSLIIQKGVYMADNRGFNRSRGRRKVCTFCVDKVEHIDYKDTNRLKKLTSEQGKILPKRMTVPVPSINAS